ncbi:MAG: hypothetical protein IH623_01135 [Verrucomicrobia bacterium]|nr:hypothetical protein [Verrucomicrobiota bacterium]
MLGTATLLNGVFYARAGDYLATSADGTNWSLRTSSILPGTSDIASDGRRLVTVGVEPGSTLLTYNAFIYVSDPLTNISLTNASPVQLALSGLVGRSYRVEYLPSLPASAANPWQTLTNLILPSSPYFIADPESPSAAQRYYRAVLLP